MTTEQTSFETRLRRRLTKGIGIVAVLGAVFLAGWNLRTVAEAAPLPTPNSTASTVAAPPPPPATAADRTIGASRDSYADLVAQVAPAVVTIRSERRVRAPRQFPFANDPMLRRFFGGQIPDVPQEPQVEDALGSGVIVKPDGYVLTNHHVVDGADQIRVELTDRRTFDAKVVGSDKPSDLAVLKINATGLHSLPLGDSDRLRVGDVVLAIGNPLGVGQTVTMGIVSAKGRVTGLSDGSFEDFIQTDAPINQGNSGGALIDTRGELVGINSQILSPSGGSIGIGFAVPANMAENVMDQLIQHGKVRRGMLGITVQTVTSDLAKSLGLSQVRGALVSGVRPGSPAERAGIHQGDVILTFDGQPVSDSNDLRNRVAGSQPDSRAMLEIQRDGHQQTVSAVLGELPTERAAADAPAGTGEGGRFGLSVEPLTPEVGQQLGIKGIGGLVVSGVTPGSPAANAGIREGDVIKQVNRKSVNSVAELKEALAGADRRPALVLLVRQGNELFVALTPHNG